MKSLNWIPFLKVIVISLLLSTICLSLSAQKVGETEDVVYLKDGSQYRGNIIERSPDGKTVIRIYGGSMIVFEAEEIDRIVRVASVTIRQAIMMPAAIRTIYNMTTAENLTVLG